MLRFAGTTGMGMLNSDIGSYEINMEANTRLMRRIRATIAIAAVIGLSQVSVADHVPDTLSQGLNPNYIACLAAVDDAKIEFRDTLQSACIQRMGDICSGRSEIAIPSQAIDCLHFETQRGIAFLQAAVSDLPESVESEGLFGYGYKRRRDSILMDIAKLQKSPKPATIEAAVQQSVIMASASTTLFWLSRETGTPIEHHVDASFGAH
ncbi:MAG: hypothetical protein AAF865_16650 [Pseudomonadota bacterium]